MSIINPSDPPAAGRLQRTSQPWPAERWLQLSVAVTAVLGTLLLAMGKGDYTASVVAALVAASAFYLVDVKEWARISPLVLNLIGLVLAIQLWYALFAQESKLIALADALVYLQCVLLYCAKTTRIYWYLLLLSLLQAAVASAINLHVMFAPVLLVYLLTAVTSLALFCLHRESRRFSQPSILHAADDAQPVTGERRWPLALTEARFAGRGTDTLDRAALRALTGKAISLSAASLAIAAVVFMALPRLGHSSWSQSPLAAQRVVGFSETVTLGAMGAVTENPEQVMTVRFTRSATGESYPLAEPPLLRGTILTTYYRGEWARSGSGSPDRHDDWITVQAQRPPQQAELVDQTISIEPLDTPIVFSVYPAIATTANQELLYNPRYPDRQQFVRTRRMQNRRATFHLTLTGLRDGKQLPITPIERRRRPRGRAPWLQLPRALSGDDPLAGLKALADQQVSGIPDTDRIGRAQALERFLREAGGFTYSLQPRSRDPALDPVEDFVTNNRAGHCEYFATALALMLRSVDIPSRVVVGFRGDEYNALGDFYQVRQLHAHAWVEALLDVEHLPAEFTDEEKQSLEGAWLRLDPTASASELALAGDGWFGLPALEDAIDYCQFLWSRYVVDMDAERQRDEIYAPLAAVVGNIIRKPFSADTYADLGQGVRLFFQLMLDAFREGRWFNWRGGLTAVLVLLAAVVAIRLLRWSTAAVKAWRSRERSAARRALARQVEFYHRLEALLARHDMRREEVQTPREFALLAGRRLSEKSGARDVADVPSRIAEAYYRIRFGGAVLTRDEVEQVQHSLRKLRTVLGPD